MKQEQMMICRKGHTLPIYKNPLGQKCDEQCKDYSYKSGGACLNLIPYEPRKFSELSGCEYLKCKYAGRDTEGKPYCKDTNEYKNTAGEAVCGRRDDAIPVEPEPQPDTCPDCGHPEHKGMCIKPVLINGIEYTCSCGYNRSWKQCEHEWHPITQGHWNCVKCGEPYYDKVPADREMPLITREQFDSIWYKTQGLFEAIEAVIKAQRDADMAWLPTHDSEVAKQAVKEFAEKVIIRLNSEYTYGGIGNELSRGHNEGLRIASEIIMAMAEGKE